MEQMEWVNIIGNVGFPIVLVFYLLARLEKGFTRLELVIKELVDEVKRGKKIW
ncbi:YvrJ family protein [Neobacillus mesonae]|uniref:YvrJ family protein n=1 Tax=Neobacillus mesonae TaxID=1193713 RepID=UPI002E1FD23E|nr:YvrJ family protein [Neobacillus mesonae]